MLLIAHVHQTDYQFLCNITKIRFLNSTSAQHDLPLLIFDFKGYQDSNERDIRQTASVVVKEKPMVSAAIDYYPCLGKAK